jgi:hypothetical protein
MDGDIILGTPYVSTLNGPAEKSSTGQANRKPPNGMESGQMASVAIPGYRSYYYVRNM